MGERLMGECVNLRERFGAEYRITWDEAREGWDESPWLMQIPCRGGITIYPHGGNLLAVEVDYHPLSPMRCGSWG